jgi:hypothetical protein
MVDFIERDISSETTWRALILFGDNSATYKFAFGKALLQMVSEEKNKITLNELSKPFADSIVEHIKLSDRQCTNPSSEFLDYCRKFNRNEISNDELYRQTERLGFRNVVKAFQNLNGGIIPNSFYEINPSNKKELILKDELLALKDNVQFDNLKQEVEARWRLVETAWNLKINPSILEVKYDIDESLIFIENNLMRRIDITSVRDALNGYQKGKCFYSGLDLNIQKNHPEVCEVDHFFPHINKLEHAKSGANINGVWNLVLSDPKINLEKLTKIPNKDFVFKLYLRNEYYIESKHPLAETIVNQTGNSAIKRQKFIQKQFDIAQQNSIQIWNPKF